MWPTKTACLDLSGAPPSSHVHHAWASAEQPCHFLSGGHPHTCWSLFIAAHRFCHCHRAMLSRHTEAACWLRYAAGATIQILLFGILAIEVKRKAPTAHTVLEIISEHLASCLAQHSFAYWQARLILLQDWTVRLVLFKDYVMCFKRGAC